MRTPRLSKLFGALAMRAAALASFAAASGPACTPSASQAECEPVAGAGCGDGERCVVDEAGEPACVSGRASVGLGEACEAVDACPEGAACARVDALATCRPFCDPIEPSGAATCRTWLPEARCVAAIGGHPEIGLCVAPCLDPSDAEGACGSAGAVSACFVPIGLDVAFCSGVPASAVLRGPCGPAARCPPGSLCTPQGEGAVCRPAAPCADEDFTLRFPGAQRYQVCAPCQLVSGPGAGDAADVRYTVCAALSTPAEATVLCEGEGGALVVRDGPQAVEIATAAAALDGLEGPVLFVGGCVVEGAPVACEAGHAACRIETGR